MTRRAVLLLPLLALACGESSAPDAVWLETGRGPGQVVYPRAIAYDKLHDEFFVCDRAAHVQRIDSSGKHLASWQMPEYGMGKPVGLTVGPDGNLWVPDTHYHRVIVYSPDGKELRRFGSEGNGPGQFIFPTDIAFDAAGRIYIGEYGGHDRIQVFDKDLNRLFDIGSFGTGDGQFSRPQSLAVVDDELIVVDACNHRVVVFDLAGRFKRDMGSVGGGPGQFRFPYGLDLDADGNLVICEFGNNRVQKIDRHTGASLGTWGGPGREPGQFAYPWAVAVDKRDRILAVDAGNNRVQVWGG